ncbi:MAG: DUF4350 domain-containing protein, partial [Actinomycetes bacterium]
MTVGDGTTTRDRAARRLSSARALLVVLALVVVVAVAGVLALPGTGGGALDPESATPEGARAVARVLADRGVAVQRVTTVDDATTAAA